MVKKYMNDPILVNSHDEKNIEACKSVKNYQCINNNNI